MLAQREHESDPNFYDESYYVHDRLGSVRMVVDTNDIDACVFVANSYTYSPFGNSYADEPPLETVANPWQFTGQYHDAEINQYYLRARQYAPTMMRFTSRDLVNGNRGEPLTLHKYLYCLNAPVNRIDLNGKWSTTTDVIITQSIRGGLQRGFGAFTEGLLKETVDWMTGEDFDWGEIGKKTAKGVAIGLVMGAIQGKIYGADLRMSRLNKAQKCALFNFAGGIAQGAIPDLYKRYKGGGGLKKAEVGVAMHNMMIDVMVASLM